MKIVNRIPPSEVAAVDVVVVAVVASKETTTTTISVHLVVVVASPVIPVYVVVVVFDVVDEDIVGQVIPLEINGMMVSSGVFSDIWHLSSNLIGQMIDMFI